jgi:hypothetical protein
MIGFFRKTPASIAGHEQRLDGLGAQIKEAQMHLDIAETRALDVALDGGSGLAEATNAVVHRSAELATLRGACVQLEIELAAMRAEAAEEKKREQEALALKKIEALAHELEVIFDDIAPKVDRAFLLTKSSDYVLGTLMSQHFAPALAAFGVLPRLVEHLRALSPSEDFVERALRT